MSKIHQKMLEIYPSKLSLTYSNYHAKTFSKQLYSQLNPRCEGVSSPSSSAAQRTIAVVGDAWTLRILRSVFRGQRRYGDFLQGFGVSRAVLTDRLTKLIGHGVLLRDVSGGGHPEYRLTERGLDLWSLFLAMWLWELDWGTARDPDTWAPDLPRLQLTHTGCGQAMRPELHCQRCNGLVSPFETQADSMQAKASQDGSLPTAAASLFRRARQVSSTGTDPARPSQRLVRVVGDRWNSSVVAAAFRGTRLFSQFQKELRIGPTQLSDRLSELQQLGILQAHTCDGNRHEYRLTKAGIALYPLTLEMVRWGNRWMSTIEESLRIKHLTCQHELAAIWHCGNCGKAIERTSLHFS
jgi:DNA-binding HxlR family transcriptional regulator